MLIELTHSDATTYQWDYLSYIITTSRDGNSMKIEDVVDSYKPLTGIVDIVINKGGIRSLNVTKDLKLKFKEIVLPWLMSLAGVTEPITGRLELHFAEGTLKKAFLDLK